MTEQDEEDYRNDNFCQIFRKKSDKTIDHCHLTGRYRRPAHNILINNVTQKQCCLFPIKFHISVNMIVLYFLKSSLKKKLVK